jgi:alpha-beta hydrolase superfamily lysophospholipase
MPDMGTRREVRRPTHVRSVSATLAAAAAVAAAITLGACGGPSPVPTSSTGATPTASSAPSAGIPATPTSTAGGSAAAGGLPARPPLSFYVAPDPLPAGRPGEIIRTMELAAPTGGRGWAVLYHSTSIDGRDIAVSGIIAAPADAAAPVPTPSDGRRVIAFAHGTTGLADPCAPSHEPLTGPTWSLLWPVVLHQGYVVAATDYEGLGTAGPHPYIVGASEAHGVLDSIRAARQLPESGAGSRALILGSSQGGHAALWTGQLAASYAPDIHLVGVVAGSPAGELRTIFVSQLRPGAASVSRLEGLLVFSAWHEVYGAPLDFLTPEALDLSARLQASSCPDASMVDGLTIFKRDPASLPGQQPWKDLAERNTPGSTRSDAPVLILQGTADPQVSARSTVEVARRLCGVGDTVDLQLFEGVGHGAAVFTPARVLAALAWVDARFSGTPAASTCDAIEAMPLPAE